MRSFFGYLLTGLCLSACAGGHFVATDEDWEWEIDFPDPPVRRVYHRTYHYTPPRTVHHYEVVHPPVEVTPYQHNDHAYRSHRKILKQQRRLNRIERRQNRVHRRQANFDWNQPRAEKKWRKLNRKERRLNRRANRVNRRLNQSRW